MTNPRKEKFIKLYYSKNWRLEMSDDLSRLKGETVERIKSMVFLCMNCNNKKPTAASLIDLRYDIAGSNATAFFICPNCRHKFTVIIHDLGKIQE